MDMLSLIALLSTVMWYLIDQGKKAWSHLTYGRWITITCAAIGGFVLSFGYGLDIIYAMGAYNQVTWIGETLTALALMGGSGAVAGIMDWMKGKN